MKIANKLMIVLGAVSMASVAAFPAVAGDCCGSAYVNGSSTIVLMNGASQSVAAELGLPNGTFFPGPAVVTPVVANDLSTNTPLFTTLTVDGGTADDIGSLGGSASFTAAAAAVLANAATLDAQVSIIRAGAGIDGLE